MSQYPWERPSSGSAAGTTPSTWSSGTVTVGGGATSAAIPTPPADAGGPYYLRVVLPVAGRRVSLLDAGGGIVGQTEYQPGGADGPDGSERIFRRGEASANIPVTISLSDTGLGVQLEVFRP